MATTEYTATQDNKGNWYVHGAGLPGYYAATLCPESRFASMEEANKSAKLCELSYKAGYVQAQNNIKLALGIKHD